MPLLSETVLLFGTPAQAAAAVASTTEYVDCIVGVFQSGAENDSNVTVTGATVSALPFPQFGDSSRAYRVTLHLMVTSSDGTTRAEVDYYDLIFQSVGRAAVAIAGADVGVVPDAMLTQRGTAAALNKVQKGLPPH